MVVTGAIPSRLFAHSATVVVEMTKEGFQPREITVDTQMMINFVNTDTVDHWPASNAHPTHDIYPEFDPTHPVKPGDFWIFRPQRVGTFKYHDHLHPHQRGTLTVIAEQNPSQPSSPPSWRQGISGFFASLGDSFRTVYRFWWPQTEVQTAVPVTYDPMALRLLREENQYDYLTRLKESHGLEASWRIVKEAYQNQLDAASMNRAHDLAHFVGTLVYKSQGIEGLSLCDPTFAFGCYHGFTEAAFANGLEPLQRIAQSCSSLGAIGSGHWASCIHGIGHGIATFYDAVELQQSLAACDSLAEGATYCHDGVFMEFSFSAPPSFYQAQNPLYPCSELKPSYQPACGRNQPTVMWHRLSMSLPDIIAACQAASSLPIHQPCIEAIGFSIAAESQGNHQVILSQCGLIDIIADQSLCVTAAVDELVFQNYPNWQQSAPAACDSLKPPFRPPCYERLQRTQENYQR